MLRSSVILVCVLAASGAPTPHAAHADGRRDALGPDGYASADARCRDTSAVVGYRRCAPFAAWRRTGPNVFVEIGVIARRLASAAPPSIARRVGVGTPSAATEGTEVISLVERIGVHVARTLYVAGEVELGTGPSASGDPHDGRAVLIGGGGVVGLRGAVPFGTLGLELVAGGRVVDDPATRYQPWGHGVVEVRGRAALWLGPWCTLGVTAGKSLLHRDEWMAGLVISAELHAFGGAR